MGFPGLAGRLGALQSLKEVAPQIVKGTIDGRRTGDQHEIDAGNGTRSDELGCNGFQAPARAVPPHRIADLAAGGEADADGFRGRFGPRLTWGLGPWRGLKDEAGRRPFAPGSSHAQKIGTPLQAADGRISWALILAHSGSSAEALTPFGAARGDDFAATNGRHARPEPMAALSDQFGRLIGTLHDDKTPRISASWNSARCIEKGFPQVNLSRA